LISFTARVSVRHGSAERPLDAAACVFAAHAFGRYSVNFDDLIAGENSRVVSRRALQRRQYQQAERVVGMELYTNAFELSGRAGFQDLVEVRWQELAVRVEASGHSVHGAVEHFLLIYFFDIVIQNQAAHMLVGGLLA
jgi:hypothetical protein